MSAIDQQDPRDVTGDVRIAKVIPVILFSMEIWAIGETVETGGYGRKSAEAL